MLSPFPGMGVTVQQNVAAAQEQIQQQKQEEKAQAEQQKTAELTSKPVVTWSSGGFGSGTRRIAYIDGQERGSFQIPKGWEGKEEQYVRQLYDKSYSVPSEVTPEIQQQRAQQAIQVAEARHAGFVAHEQEQRDLLAGFMRRVGAGEVRATEEAIAKAQAAGYDVSQAKPITQVGIEAAKVAEAKVAQEQKAFAQSLAQMTPEKAAQIETLLRSPTAEFASQAVVQKGYDLVGKFHPDFKPEDVKAHLKVEAPPEKSPVGTTDISGIPKIPSILHPAPSQEVSISGEVLQRMEDQRTQAKAEKWWNSLSNTEKASALVAAGTIDISVAGKYFGSKAAESRYINQQIKDIAFGSEKGKQYIIDAYKTLNIEGAKTQTPTQRFEEGLVKVGTGTSAQALATMVGFGAGTKIITGGAKAIGVSETGIAAAEKLVGTGFKVAIGAELGGKVVEGKGGEAIAEAGLIATTIPFAAVGSRAVTEVGKFTPTPQEFMKFTGEKVITPIRGTETFKFTAEKTPEVVKEAGKTFIEKGAVAPARTLEAGITSAEKLVTAPEVAKQTIKESMPTLKEFSRFVEKKTEPIIKSLEEKHPDIAASLKTATEPIIDRITRQPSAYSLMTPALREIYNEVSPQRKIKIEAAVRLMEALRDAPPEIKQSIDFTSPKYGGKIGLELKKIIEKNPTGFVIGGSTSVGAFVPEFRRGADFDIYAKNYIKTVEQIAELTTKKYSGSKYKGEPFGKFITQIESAEGHGIVDIHKITEITGKIGEPITTKLGKEEGVRLTTGTIRRPIKVKGIQYLDPREQLFRKAEGTFKFLKSETLEEGKLKEQLGSRAKDAPDFLSIAESLARSKARTGTKTETERIKKELESFKLHAKSPEAVLVETGYAIGKEFLKPEHKALPLFTNEKPIVEKSGYDYGKTEKSPLDYYPTEGKKVTDLTGGYYPVKVITKPPSGYYGGGGKGKPSGGYVPPEHKPKPDGGYYPPQRPPRRLPPVTRREPPIETTKKAEEAAFVKGLEVRDEAKKVKQKETKGYVYKPRISPIFELGVEELFSNNPVVKKNIVSKKTNSKINKNKFWSI